MTLDAPTPPQAPLNDPRTVNAWAMFDWANSAFALVITVAIFPAYFESVVFETVRILGIEMESSALFSWLITLAYLLIAAVSPFLSGIADAGGKRLWFLKIFTTIGAISCTLLFFFTSMETLWLGSLFFVLGLIGFAGGLVFYNSFLPIISTPDKFDTYSAKGFALGFAGSVLLLIVNLIMVMKPDWFGLPDASWGSRVSFITVGVWWYLFARIPFRRLPQDKKVNGNLREMGRAGYKEIKSVWQKVKGMTQLKRFLFSFFCYSTGVQTILFLASLFADKELGFGGQDLIILILILQIVAIAGAYLFSWLSGLYGNRVSLLIILFIWLIICAVGYVVASKPHFYLLGGAVGLVMGGTQSLSRSTYAKLIPDPNESTSYYSFYDVLEKVAIVVGTLAFGLVNQLTGSMRYSILVLGIFFVLGIILLFRFRLGQSEAAN
ncbi:MAG: MFS transporter [Bacteroidota bacterium]